MDTEWSNLSQKSQAALLKRLQSELGELEGQHFSMVLHGLANMGIVLPAKLRKEILKAVEKNIRHMDNLSLAITIQSYAIFVRTSVFIAYCSFPDWASYRFSGQSCHSH